MALLYIDGFDAYGSADFSRRWADVGGHGMGPGLDWQVEAGGGRYGNACARVSSLDARRIWHALGGNYSNLVVGFAFKVAHAAVSGQYQRIFQTIGNGQYGLEIGLSSAGGVDVRRLDGYVVCTAPAANIQANVWYYYELKQTISSSVAAGQVVLRINEQVVAQNAGSFNGTFWTRSGFGGQIVIGDALVADTIGLCGLQSGFDLGPGRWDDLYALDLTGATNNDFLGDMRVEAIYPTGAGTYADFTPTGAASNWQAVADTTIDNDATYVSGNAVGQKDTYRFAGLSSVPTTVRGFQLSLVTRKDDAGGRILATQLRSGGADFTSGRHLSVGDQYAVYTDIWNQNPNGNVPWSGASGEQPGDRCLRDVHHDRDPRPAATRVSQHITTPHLNR